MNDGGGDGGRNGSSQRARSCPAPERWSMATVATVGAHGGVDDREAEPAPAVVPAAGRVGPVEALEGACRIGVGHARARRRATSITACVPSWCTRTSIGAPGGVHARVGHAGWRPPGGGERRHRRTVTGPTTAATIARSGSTARASLTASSTSLPRSTGARSSGRPWSRRARWSRSSTSGAHADRLLLGAAHGVVELARLVEGAGPVELGVPADRGDRGAELVGRVGDELAQPRLGRGPLVERLLDAAEHAVERDAEVAGLGARRALGDALATGRPPAIAPAVVVIRRTGRTPRWITHQITSPSTPSTATDREQPRRATSRRDDVVDVVERAARHDHGRAEPGPGAGLACGSRRAGSLLPTVIGVARAARASTSSSSIAGSGGVVAGGSGRADGGELAVGGHAPDVERAEPAGGGPPVAVAARGRPARSPRRSAGSRCGAARRPGRRGGARSCGR